jgi:hypothetical protein
MKIHVEDGFAAAVDVILLNYQNHCCIVYDVDAVEDIANWTCFHGKSCYEYVYRMVLYE